MSSVTGVVSSTTGTSLGAGGAQWQNPNNIFTSNSVYAVCASASGLTTGVSSGYIYALGNGFSIPSTATIDGISIDVIGKNGVAGSGFRVRTNLSDIFLRYAGTSISPNSPTGIATQTWSGTTNSTKTFGSSTSLWDATLTPTIVNDSSFGVAIRFNNGNATTQSFSLDYVAITVYYTVSGVQSSQQFFSRRF